METTMNPETPTTQNTNPVPAPKAKSRFEIVPGSDKTIGRMMMQGCVSGGGTGGD
jgi:hypothetical protein